VRSNPHSRTFENLRVFSRQLLVRVVNHTLLLIRSVSRFSAQYQFSELKPSQSHFWEPPSLSRQLLLCVVNHTLLLIQSVSQFSTKHQFSEVKPSQSHFWEPPSFFSAVTRVRRKLHTIPNTECVTILYKISVQWVETLTHALLSTTESFSEVSRARSKSHTTPDTECVTTLCKMLVHCVSDKRTFENLRVFLRQILMRVVNHTLLLIRTTELFPAVTRAHSKSHNTPDTECVTILYKTFQFSEVKPSQSHFWESPSLSRQLLVRVVNHTLLLIRSVPRFSTKHLSSVRSNPHSRTFENHRVVSGSYSCT